MIAANYASAWVGGVLIGGAAVGLIPMDLNNGWKWFWVMVGVTYCLTLLIEWPFMAFLLRKNPGWMKRSAGAALGVQSVSYLVVFGWYWLASGTSLYTTAQVVRPQELSLPESVCYETPFGAWAVRNVVHLPSDKVLFQLGEDQICGFDPVKRQVALLWRGRGPVPVIGKRGME